MYILPSLIYRPRSADRPFLGLHFVSRLLEEDPERRMSLTEALHHEWFAQYHTKTAPVSQERRQEIDRRASVIRDVSMKEALSQSMSMNLDAPSSAPLHIPGAFPPSQPIQRRRKVLDEAREKGEAVEPTPEMIERARLAQQKEEEELYARNSRPLKRKADNSKPIDLVEADEEDGKAVSDDDMGGGGGGGMIGGIGSVPPRVTRASRRGRVPVPVEVEEVTPVKAQRGRAGRGRGGKSRHQDRVEPEDQNTDGSPRLRRSARHCSTKTGRR